MAGPALLQALAPQGAKAAGKEIAKEIGKQALYGVAMEQTIPRLLGAPAPSLGESVVRSTVGATLAAPLSYGLQRVPLPGGLTVPRTVAEIGSSLLTAGPAAQLTRSFIDPEPHQNVQATYSDLATQQQAQALSEGERYDKQIALAYARNYTSPTHVYHHSISSAPAAELAGRVASQMGQVHRYM